MNDRKKENKVITEAIKFFEFGSFNERKQYLNDLRTDKGASYNGFTFNEDTWCWIVWKPTDMEKEPQFKGEPLCKVIPKNVLLQNIPAVLDAQPWTYI